jgi:uncharacterized membrane protein
MNLVSILYEPYFIIIVLSLIVVVIAYFLLKNEKPPKKGQEQNNMPLSRKLLYTFLISFIAFIGIYFVFKNFTKGSTVLTGGGGGAVVDLAEKLTMVADDVEFGILED